MLEKRSASPARWVCIRVCCSNPSFRTRQPCMPDIKVPLKQRIYNAELRLAERTYGWIQATSYFKMTSDFHI